MNNPMIFVGTLLVAIIGVNGRDLQLPQELMEKMEICMKENGISADEQMEAVKNDDFSDPKFRCVSNCMMTKNGMMEGKNIILDKVITLVHSIHPEMSAENVKEIHEKCDAEAQKQEDICDFAKEYETCFRKSTKDD